MTIQPGTYAGAPAIILPGSFGIPSVAPLYVDGIQIMSPAAGPGAPASAIILPGSQLFPVQQISSGTPMSPAPVPGKAGDDSQRFWSTPPRAAADPHRENLIVSLAKAKLINYISLDLPHFPHQFQAYWQDGDGNWQPVCGPGGSVLLFMISGSVPVVVNNAAALAAGLNPYHYGAGHWVHYDEMVQPFTAQQMIFTGSRMLSSPSQGGTFPVDSSGRLHPYPLGVRNLDFGYRARSAADIPWTPRSPAIVTERETFTTATDMLGSPVTLSVRENRASDMLQGLPWKCAPQARSDAVVCLYADARDVNGNPQTVDRFYLDPVTSGVRVNLYYSPAAPDESASFQAIDAPLSFPLTDVNGSTLPVIDGEGLLFADAPGWLDLNSQGPGADSSAPWWAGIEVMPQFASGDPGSYMIADGGIAQVCYSGGQWTVGCGGGILAAWNFPFSFNQALQFVLGFDGAQMFAWSPLGGASFAAAAPPLPGVSFIRFGAVQDPNFQGYIWPGNYRLTSFVLKQEFQDFSGAVPADFLSFAAGADGFVAPQGGPGPTTMNALARFSPSFVLGTPEAGINPYGFAGGPGSSYESCTWTPVQRDYTLARGFMQFDPVLASVFKFEFTGLQPQTYEFFESTPQAVQLFPAAVMPSHPVPPGHKIPLDNGLTVTQSVAPVVTFSDAPGPVLPRPAGASLPTEAVYATDPATAAAMVTSGGSLYNFQQWQPQPSVPRFESTSVHAYQVTEVQQVSRVAYFVALSSLQMYRMAYTAQDDAAEYVDGFTDTANVNPGSLAYDNELPSPWSWQAGMLFTPTGLAGGYRGFAQIFSQVFNSQHAVRGVQFAATQSDPVQLLADPDFSDPVISFWANSGDASDLEIAQGINAQLGSVVQVSRVPSANTWAGIAALFPVWSQIAAAASTWDSMQGEADQLAYGGMTYTGAPVAVTQAGRVYAAARVFSPVPLSAPLALQILDGPTGSVLAEADMPVSGGNVTEWFVGYTIGSGGSVSAYPWTEIQANYPAWNATAGMSWSAMDTFVAPLGTTMKVQLIQRGVTDDTWFVDNISLFEDSVVWEFSNDGGVSWWAAYDIRNNPRGVLLFPPPAQGIGNQLMWRLSGYRPGLHVSALAIRPWYGIHPMGVPPRAAGVGHGPNMAPLDHYALIEDDPRWQAWDLPIPQDWFFLYRQLLLGAGIYIAQPPTVLPVVDADLGNALVVSPPAYVAPPPPVGPPPVPQTFTDVYPDAYLDFYGAGDGGDVFTDTYSDYYWKDT
jgi:hypothetical protein